MTRIHFIGISGSGLSAIARLLMEAGYTVTGSDRALSPMAHELELLGAVVYLGHAGSQVLGADIVVRSSAIPDNNPEVVAAQAAGIPVLKRAEFLGQWMTGRLGIAVAGTHGKTTTTAMIAWMLTSLGQDPAYIIGGVSKNLHNNAHFGHGQAFVIEADEYDRMFLGLQPQVIVLTVVEHDHPDCYPTPEDYFAAFRQFIQRLQPGGLLLVNAQDAGALSLISAAPSGCTVLTYGTGPDADYALGTLDSNATHCPRAEVTRGGKLLAELSLQVAGEHNLRNAAAALAVADHLKLDLSQAAQALGQFTGTGRRFDVQGEANGIAIIDDYAHHPTEIRTTLAAARSRYPSRRIWAVWQPHTYSRTQALLADFATSFNDADGVIITDIYASRESNPGFSSSAILSHMTHPNVHFIPDLPSVVAYLLECLEPGDVLLVCSAGDADQVSAQVLAGLKTDNSQKLDA